MGFLDNLEIDDRLSGEKGRTHGVQSTEGMMMMEDIIIEDLFHVILLRRFRKRAHRDTHRGRNRPNFDVAQSPLSTSAQSRLACRTRHHPCSAFSLPLPLPLPFPSTIRHFRFDLSPIAPIVPLTSPIQISPKGPPKGGGGGWEDDRSNGTGGDEGE
ncbi:hypothetical protein AKJ16_DCAP26841 [Drosera capensis]